MFVQIKIERSLALGFPAHANRRTAAQATRIIAENHREFNYAQGVMEVDALLPIAISLLQTTYYTHAFRPMYYVKRILDACLVK